MLMRTRITSIITLQMKLTWGTFVNSGEIKCQYGKNKKNLKITVYWPVDTL